LTRPSGGSGLTRISSYGGSHEIPRLVLVVLDRLKRSRGSWSGSRRAASVKIGSLSARASIRSLLVTQSVGREVVRPDPMAELGPGTGSRSRPRALRDPKRVSPGGLQGRDVGQSWGLGGSDGGHRGLSLLPARWIFNTQAPLRHVAPKSVTPFEARSPTFPKLNHISPEPSQFHHRPAPNLVINETIGNGPISAVSS
jgi:hypothetical protein